MVDAKVGIEIEASDKTGGAIGKVGVGVKTARKALADMGDTGKKAFDTLGKSIVVFNQALELGKKAFNLLKAAIGETIDKALEFRKADDAARKFFDNAKRGSELLRARIGDILIPIVIGVSKAFETTNQSTDEWLKTNRKLIASKIVEFLSQTAEILVKGIAKGVFLVVKAWLNWKLLIITTRQFMGDFFKELGSGIEKALRGFAALVGIFDIDLQRSILKAGEVVASLGAKFGVSGEEAAAAMEKTAKEIEAAEKAMKGFETTALRVLKKVKTSAEQQIASSISGTRKTVAEQEVAAAKARALAEKEVQENNARIQLGLDRFFEARQQEQAVLEQARAVRREREEADSARSIARAQEVGDTLAGITSNLVTMQLAADETVAESAKKALKGILLATLEQVKRIILAKAAEAAAKQGAAAAGTLVGLVVAPVAAAAMFALIAAFINRLAGGGLITGGRSGTDSVPALLTPGEVVIPAGVVRQFSGQTAQTRSGVVTAQRGGVVPGVSVTPDAGAPQINVTFSSLIPPSSAEAKRAVREFGKELIKLNARGMFSLAR